MPSELAQLLAQPIAHRGLHGCGRGGPVENSLGAARAAVAASYAMECDVRLSRDGEAMVFHDAALERLTGAPGQLGDQDAATLRRLDLAGGFDHVPTLPELLEVISGHVPLVIEMKADAGGTALADRVLDLVETYKGVVALESFDDALVQYCRSRTTHLVGLVGPAEDGSAADPDTVASCDFLSWSVAHLGSVAAAYPNTPLTTWTVRTPAQIREAVKHRAQIVFEGISPFTLG